MDESRRWTRRVFAPLAVICIGSLCVALFVLPLRTWSRQRAVIAQRTEQLNAYEDINASLQEEVDNLKTPKGAQEAVRSQLGYLAPSEKRVPLLKSPSASGDLPDRWPYSIVTNILKINLETSTADPTSGLLSKLQP